MSSHRGAQRDRSASACDLAATDTSLRLRRTQALKNPKSRETDSRRPPSSADFWDEIEELCGEVLEDVRLKRVDDARAAPLRANEPGGAKHTKVMRQRRLAQMKTLGDLPAGDESV